MMKKILLIVGVIAVILAAGWAVKALTTVQAKARNSRLSTDVESLFDGLQKYKDFVGAYPIGSNADIAKALQGQNARKVTVLVGRKLEVNGKGEYIDPWGTPLRIYFSDTSVLIRSAGPNRRFDENTTMEFDDFIRSN
jgi:type II secretory pathway pseudopilin PulG